MKDIGDYYVLYLKISVIMFFDLFRVNRKMVVVIKYFIWFVFGVYIRGWFWMFNFIIWKL